MQTRSVILLFAVAALMAAGPGGADQSMGSEKIISAQDFDEYHPDVAFNSTHQEYLVVWHDASPLQSRSVMGKRVDMNGDTIAEFIIAFEDAPPRDNAQPAVAYDPINDLYLVTWVRDFFGNDSDWDVYGRIVPWDGPVAGQAQFSICGFTSKQWNPKVAFARTAGEFLVTWWNEGSGGANSYISAQRVTPTGSLTNANFVVTSGTEERVVPDISYNQARNEYLIVFQHMGNFGDIYGVRLTGTGSIIGTGAFSIASWADPETAPRVSASRVADEWAIVWQSDVPGLLKDIYARRMWVDGAGTNQFSAPVSVDSSGLDERNPDIAAFPENTEYLISWEGQYSNTSGPFGIFARTLNTTNSLGATFNPRMIYIGEPGDYTSPAVAASPSGWLVAWEHDRDDVPTYQDIHARAVYGPLFTDGFETGDLSVWDAHSP